jgi:hypothetical protein
MWLVCRSNDSAAANQNSTQCFAIHQEEAFPPQSDAAGTCAAVHLRLCTSIVRVSMLEMQLNQFSGSPSIVADLDKTLWPLLHGIRILLRKEAAAAAAVHCSKTHRSAFTIPYF